MKNVCLFALVLSLAAGVPAIASTLCAGAASQNGYGGDTFTPVAGPLDGTCGANSALTMSIPNDVTGYARLEWSAGAGDPNYPTNLTLGNLGSMLASVVGSPTNVSGDQPFYMLSFYDNSLALNPGDQILMIEFQSSTDPGGVMAMGADTTLFNLYDNTVGTYLLNGVANPAGQQDAQTLDYWLSQYPSLDADSIAGVRIGIGMDGGQSGPAESFTVNSLDVEETSPVPEPGSLLLLGTGLLGLAGAARRRLFL